eukprot:GHVR01131892.1.p1 GENE.GHVR01131892.1~~GHVR01131892.1.p1  ORF type:complete len:395 (+),score=79.91 GHVR01131892.1:59-1243(+)
MRLSLLVSQLCLLSVFCKVDYYEVLEISRDIAQADIKKQYRRMSVKYHPDKSSSADASIKFAAINEAYEVLSDEKKRKVYDTFGINDIDGLSYNNMKDYFDQLDSMGGVDLYRHQSHVSIIWRGNVNELMHLTDTLWVITFYHPNCGGCQQLVPNFIQSAQIAKIRYDDYINNINKNNNANANVDGNVRIRFGAINCGFDMRQCFEFGVQQFGLIFIFPPNQSAQGHYDKEHYRGPHTPQLIIDTASNFTKDLVVNIKNMSDFTNYVNKGVVSSESTRGLVSAWLIDYWQPGCPPCLVVKASLRKLAENLQGVVKVASANCVEVECPSVGYHPYVELWLRWNDSKGVQKIHIDYNQEDGHPAVLAMTITANIIRQIFSLQWIDVQDNKHVHDEF